MPVPQTLPPYAAALALLLAGCASQPSPATLRPFTTDGCSLFPNRSLISKSDWCSCCVAHDVAYWRGGTAEERLKADLALKACVQRATDNPALAELMYAGVREGGGPYFFTSYRWGYGWPYGRSYAPLTTQERDMADEFEKRYLETNPSLSCEAR